MHTVKQRTLAYIISMVFFAVALFSVLFIVKEADHDCTGENCPVCACIHQAEQTLKQLTAQNVERAWILPSPSSGIMTVSFAVLFVSCISLISLKVRLDN